MLNEALIRLPEVMSRVGLSKSSIYLFMHKGEFPPSVNIGARAKAWPESWIQTWLDWRKCGSELTWKEFQELQEECKKPQEN